MSYFTKPLEDLDLLDDFLMNAVACDERVGILCCRKILSVLLQREIGNVRITAQKAFPGVKPGLRGIRMDVEIEEFKDTPDSVANVYDLEPHLQKDTNFPKHNRFYQAKIDSRYMKSGEHDFSKMPNLYVITITNFDLFGENYMMYTFRNKCVEVPDLPYEDGLQFIYFNTTGTKGGCKEIGTLLHYMQESTAANATDETTRELHDYVSEVKILPEVRNGYMHFEEIMYYAKKEGIEEGKELGKELGALENQILNVLELLEDLGPIPEGVQTKIQATTDLTLLKQWLKIAAKATSIEDFMQKIES